MTYLTGDSGKNKLNIVGSSSLFLLLGKEDKHTFISHRHKCEHIYIYTHMLCLGCYSKIPQTGWLTKTIEI